jgi:hypothetical protein
MGHLVFHAVIAGMAADVNAHEKARRIAAPGLARVVSRGGYNISWR